MKTKGYLFLCWLGFIFALLGFLMRVYSKGFDTLCLCFSLPAVVFTLVIAIILTLNNNIYKR